MEIEPIAISFKPDDTVWFEKKPYFIKAPLTLDTVLLCEKSGQQTIVAKLSDLTPLDPNHISATNPSDFPQ